MKAELKKRINVLNEMLSKVLPVEANGYHWGSSEPGYPRYVLWYSWWPSYATNSFREAKRRAQDIIATNNVELYI